MTQVLSASPWKESLADREALHNAELIEAYLEEVLQPTLKTCMDRMEAALAKAPAHDPVTAFFDAERLETLQAETAKGLCLALAATFERHLRLYVRECAVELDPTLEKASVSSKRREVLKAFKTMRGYEVEPPGSVLAQLNDVANVCRHGEGDSMERLWLHHPEYWPMRANPEFDAALKAFGPAMCMTITSDHLAGFAGAVAEFWRELHRKSGVL